jgi:hypothetical protein
MKSFRLEKTSGNADVTHEALIWLLVFVLVVAPVLYAIYWIAS